MLTKQPRKIPQHFSEILREEFQIRVQKNQNYSLRAYARDLGVTSGNLSNILNQKLSVSYKKAVLISKKLNLDVEDQKLFLKLVETHLTSSYDNRTHLQSQHFNYDSSFMTLNDDYYCVLTEWYYFAIVELVRVVDFKNDDEWISNRLNIPINLVRPAIERLVRVELLANDAGNLIQTYDYFISPSGTPLDAAKKIHRQLLIKAIDALEVQEIEERNFTSGFLRVRMKDLPYVERRIKEFRRELAKELESGDSHDSIYCLSVQFFRGDHSKGPSL